jgi:hypothetical protein
MTCVRQAWLVLGSATVQLEDLAAGYVCQNLDLGWPDIREVKNGRPDRDGLDDRTQLFGGRPVTAQITALTGAGATIDAVAASFAPFMVPSARPVLHYVLDRSGAAERTVTLRSAGYAWQVAGPYQRDIHLAWIAADPYVYDPAVQTASTTPAGAGADISAAGDTGVWPRLQITGPVTGADLTFTPSLPPVWHLAFLSSFTVAAGHYIDIDTGARTVYLDGDPAKPRLSSLDWTRSTWQWVPPAPNTTTMTLSGTATTGATNVTATWQDAYLT